MAARLLSRSLLAGFLLLFTPGAGQAQSLNIDSSLRNIPKEPVTPPEPSPLPSPPPAASPGATPAEVPFEPQRLRPTGTYVDRFSGVPFPKQVGEFTRMFMDKYDAEGRNVGAAYDLKRGGNLVCVANAFSYPLPARFATSGTAAVFEREKLAISSRQQGTRLIREEPFRAADGSTGDFAELEFPVGKPVTVMRARLYLFASNGWLLKIQVSYPSSRVREGALEADAFLRAFGTAPVRSASGN